MYTLNSVDLSTYSVVASHAPSSNIALSGSWNLPKRLGKTFHSWGEENSIEAYTDSADLMYGGRDIKLYGNIFGTDATINTALDSLYTAINAFSDLVELSTPYGDFDVQVKEIKETRIVGASSLVFEFREPVVTLTGGSLPSVVANDYMFDGRPFSSFGFYLSKAKAIDNLPELKEQHFTIYGKEGYQIVKRKNKTLELNGFIIATSLADFQTKIKALYLLFSSSGTRTVVLNSEISAVTFAKDGFNVSNVQLFDTTMIANFKCNLTVISSSYI